MPGRLLFLALSFALLAAAAGPARAQQLAGCEATRLSPPPRVAYRCSGGLVIEAEVAVSLRVVAAEGGRPSLVGVSGAGAVLVETGVRATRFQILTPHAIASVRGTVWAVDVGASGTAVFVRDGRVSVSRRDGSESVVLSPGEGVDVTPGEPLVVKRWGAARVEGLLARFGR